MAGSSCLRRSVAFGSVVKMDLGDSAKRQRARIGRLPTPSKGVVAEAPGPSGRVLTSG